MTFFCFCVITYQAGLPSVEECLQKAEQFCDENKFLEAMKYYLVSSSPELALDIGLNLVRGKIAGGPHSWVRVPVQPTAVFSVVPGSNLHPCLLFAVWLPPVSWGCSVCIICLLLPETGSLPQCKNLSTFSLFCTLSFSRFYCADFFVFIVSRHP